MTCPDNFFFNCREAYQKCNNCKAKWPKAKLQYDPIMDIGQHPADKLKDSVKSARGKEARKNEKTSLLRIAKSTIASGAKFNDGDGILLDDIRLEHKDRGTTRSFTVTEMEYNKGIQQGVQVWEILANDRRAFFMTEDLFYDLLAIKVKKEGILETEDG